jgi:hypothetical protein
MASPWFRCIVWVVDVAAVVSGSLSPMGHRSTTEWIASEYGSRRQRLLRESKARIH